MRCDSGTALGNSFVNFIDGVTKWWGSIRVKEEQVEQSGWTVINCMVKVFIPYFFQIKSVGASDWCAQQEALYKCVDTIQYNTKQLTKMGKLGELEFVVGE